MRGGEGFGMGGLRGARACGHIERTRGVTCKRQRLHDPRDTSGPIQHNLAGSTQAAPVRPSSPGRASTKHANRHLILSQFRPSLPLIPNRESDSLRENASNAEPATTQWLAVSRTHGRGGAGRVGAPWNVEWK